MAEIKKENKSKKSREDKQTKIIFWIAGIIILSLFMIFAFKQSSRSFTYSGIDFQKTTQGKTDFYTAKVPVFGLDKKIKNYILIDFRNDPRKLKDIPVIKTGDIKFTTNKITYVSYDGNMSKCEDNSLAGANFGFFLLKFNIEYKGAINDVSYKDLNSTLPYVNCDTHPNNTVIYITNSNETKIEQTAKYCYVVSFKDCEILKALEKFEFAVLEQYMGYYK